MYAFPLRAAAVALSAAAGLSACPTPYGYVGVSMGVGNGYYDSSYGGYGYGYPGYGYGSPASYGYSPYGWYDNYYYPGTGYYVYDTYRRPHRWTDAQRRYWRQRIERAQARTSGSQPVVIRENWNDFSRTRPADRSNRVYRSDNQTVRVDRFSRPVTVDRIRPDRVEQDIVRSERPNEASVRPERVERSIVRSEARDDRAAVREQRHSAAREERANRSNGRKKDLDD